MTEDSAEREPTRSKGIQGQSYEIILSGALVTLTALLPNPVLRTVAGAISPLIGYLAGRYFRRLANDWEDDRKAEAPIRRTKKYLREAEAKLQRQNLSEAERRQVALHAQQLRDIIHKQQLGKL